MDPLLVEREPVEVKDEDEDEDKDNDCDGAFCEDLRGGLVMGEGDSFLLVVGSN